MFDTTLQRHANRSRNLRYSPLTSSRIPITTHGSACSDVPRPHDIQLGSNAIHLAFSTMKGSRICTKQLTNQRGPSWRKELGIWDSFVHETCMSRCVGTSTFQARHSRSKQYCCPHSTTFPILADARCGMPSSLADTNVLLSFQQHP